MKNELDPAQYLTAPEHSYSAALKIVGMAMEVTEIQQVKAVVSNALAAARTKRSIAKAI